MAVDSVCNSTHNLVDATGADKVLDSSQAPGAGHTSPTHVDEAADHVVVQILGEHPN